MDVKDVDNMDVDKSADEEHTGHSECCHPALRRLSLTTVPVAHRPDLSPRCPPARPTLQAAGTWAACTSSPP
jgi:hypothetical protein